MNDDVYEILRQMMATTCNHMQQNAQLQARIDVLETIRKRAEAIRDSYSTPVDHVRDAKLFFALWEALDEANK